MRIYAVLFWLVLFSSQALAGTVHVSETDYRDYRPLTLSTGLRVLLVHDKKAATAAAAIAVPVGSLDDAPAQPGLAHYLEHMLFLGSESYPGADAYQDFITRNGGHTNAATAYTSTTYLMEISPAAFAEGVERMADTIAHPLLDPRYADKERHAINAEMEARKYSDQHRLNALELSTLNPAHPATHFTGGNLETLSDKPGSILHQELTRFHQTWYSANLMTAVLYGPQSLDSLEALARKELSRIPNRQKTLPELTIPPATQKERGMFYTMRSLQNRHELRVDFILPQAADDPQTRPLQSITAVLGTETRHSLVDILRKEGLVLGLSAGADTRSLRNGVLCTLSAQLTKKGAAQPQKVLKILFRYLHMLQNQGIPQKYFDQQKRIRDAEFRFAPLQRGADYAAYTANQMLYYPTEEVHRAPYSLPRYDAQAIQETLNAMTPEKARIFLAGPEEPSTREAFFYQTPYAERPLTPQELSTFSEAPPIDMLLPDMNPFVPHTLQTLPKVQQAPPQKVLEEKGLALWHGRSQAHPEPKTVLQVRFASKTLNSSLREAALQGLFLEFWRQAQAGLRYQAQEAGMDLALYGDQDIVLRISGLSAHQDQLLRQSLAFWDEPLTPEAFIRAKTARLQNLQNARTNGVFGQTMGSLGALLEAPAWEPEILEESTEDLSLADLQSYRARLRQNAHCTAFGFGNISAEQMQHLKKTLRPYCGQNPSVPEGPGYIRPAQGLSFDYRRVCPLDDSVLVETFLDPDQGPDSKARMLVLESLLSTPFYSRLRTEEQLGYIVSSFPLLFGRNAGIGFGVQSPVRGTQILADRFESFYLACLPRLRTLSARDFSTARQGLVRTLERPSDSLEEEFSWLEADLRRKNFRFDTRKSLARAVQKVTHKDVVHTYEHLVLGPAGTRIRIQYQGQRFAQKPWAHSPKTGHIKSPQELHTTLPKQAE